MGPYLGFRFRVLNGLRFRVGIADQVVLREAGSKTTSPKPAQNPFHEASCTPAKNP